MKTAHKGYKVQRGTGDPVAEPAGNPRFIPIPAQFKKPQGDLTMDLETVMSAELVQQITDAKKMLFHIVGDTGPIQGADAMLPVSQDMEKNATETTLFYHLGDVVYFNGQSTQYDPQFYTYYDGYPGKIVAIPGNHDCSTVIQKGDAPDTEPSLLGFMENFCSPSQVYHSQSAHRKNMNQPWPYWALNTPYAYFIGLFSNYDGLLDKGNDTTQYEWLVEQLKKPMNGQKLIVTVHHPCYSLDSAEGGYPAILNDLDKAFAAAKKYPDLILSGHVHNYQRFSRTIAGHHKPIPYVVAGNGGYAHSVASMHKLQTPISAKPLPKTGYPVPEAYLNPSHTPTPLKTTALVLEAYNQTEPGYLSITIDSKGNGLAKYVLCPIAGAPVQGMSDSFTF